jgi:hypothetical protein
MAQLSEKASALICTTSAGKRSSYITACYKYRADVQIILKKENNRTVVGF